MIEMLFDAASVDVSDYRRLTVPVASELNGMQVMRMFAWTDDSDESAAAIVQLCLVREGRVIGFDRASVVGTGLRRSGISGVDGEYSAVVVWESTGTDKTDLLGCGYGSGSGGKRESLDVNEKNAYWMIGLATLPDDYNSVRVFLEFSEHV
jgi:hypothetical protein